MNISKLGRTVKNVGFENTAWTDTNQLNACLKRRSSAWGSAFFITCASPSTHCKPSPLPLFNHGFSCIFPTPYWRSSRGMTQWFVNTGGWLSLQSPFSFSIHSWCSGLNWWAPKPISVVIWTPLTRWNSWTAQSSTNRPIAQTTPLLPTKNGDLNPFEPLPDGDNVSPFSTALA